MKKIFFTINLIFVFSLLSFTNSNAYITKKSGDILCVSKSFNANYRLSKWKCTDDEREVPKGTAEYNEGLEFLKISDLVVGSNSKAPVLLKSDKSKINTQSNKFGSKKNYQFCKYFGWGSPYLTDRCPSSRILTNDQYVIEKLNYWAFGPKVKNNDPNERKIIFNKVKNQIISEFDQKGLSSDYVYSIINGNAQFASLNDNNKSIVKLASTSKYITKKKSNNTKAIEEIENLYSNGFLSKKECVRAKVKILKLPSASESLCDNVKVKVVHKDDKAIAQNKYITKKEKEKRKSYITKKNKEVAKKQKTKKKFYSSLKDLPNGSFYFFAVDKKDNQTMIGYVNPDPKSKMIKLNNRSFRKENLGYLYKKGGMICDVLSTIENSRSARIYSGSIDVNCPKGFYIGNWVQNGNKGSGNAIDEKGNELNYFFFMKRNDAIAKFREEEKNTIVVKKPKQEKQVKIFQPKSSEIDDKAPTIKTKLKITSKSPNFIIEGVIKDNKKHKQGPFLEIADENVNFNKVTGKFSKKFYSPFSTEITLAATDVFGNREEIVVQVEIKDVQTQIAKKLEPLNPSKGRNFVNPNTVAVVIGIEKYEKVVSSPYSNLDAKYFSQYLKKVARSNNIITLVDEKATRNESISALVKHLKSKVKKDETDVYIFFSGHGLAANEKDLYLMAKDSDSDLLEFTALNRKEIIKIVAGFKPKSVTMFLDTCYSGVSRKGEQLVASARPIRVKVTDDLDIPNNFNIFSASQASQISSSMKKAKQGIFSYYLMKGMEGNADSNKDRNITNKEMHNYLQNKVSQKALEIYSREQLPAFTGSPEKILWRY